MSDGLNLGSLKGKSLEELSVSNRFMIWDTLCIFPSKPMQSTRPDSFFNLKKNNAK